MNTTYCPTCGCVTDYGTAPHVEWQECGLCARRRVWQARAAQIIAGVWFGMLAGLIVSLIASVVMGAGR
mgnify:CR=1 FL=1